MGRIRYEIVLFAALAIMASGVSAWSLTAADQAFLKKKIVARWNITGKRQIEAAYDRGVDILEDHPNPANGHFTILVSSDELDGLRADGYSIDVVEPDWYASYTMKTPQAYGGFLRWAEAIDKLDSFHTAYPAITTEKFSLGDSHEGNALWAIKVSDNPDLDEDEPEVLITAIHHAREPIGMEIVLHTIRTLLFNYGADPDITNLVNGREVWFVPFVNPDGYLYNEDIASNGGGMWRKNRRLNAGGTYGVDPNRNYGYNWGYDNSGSSGSPGSDVYRGPSAFSEPENQHIRDLVLARNFVIAVNYHSYSDLFLWAPGYADFYTADEMLFRAIGDSVTSFNGYTPEPGWALYNTNGDSDDWMYFAEGILSFTPEVGSGSQGFWPNAADIPGLVNENIGPNLVLIEIADGPGRLLPPTMPTWVGPATVPGPDYMLEWSDAGGLNAAVSFELKELIGPAVIVEDAESGSANWEMDQFALSSARKYSGAMSYWGGSSDNRRAHMTSDHYLHPVAGDSIRVRIFYDNEANYDYAYVEVSSDYGQSWATLPGNITTNYNPNGTNRGNGITGTSGGTFTLGKFSLAAYVGNDILIRLSYETDGGVLGEGVYFDDISPVMTFGSKVVLDPASENSTFAVTGKSAGDYYYSVKSQDAQGQVAAETPPHKVTVVGNTPSGTNVEVSPSEGSSVTFGEVTSTGMTTVTVSTSGPPPPGGITIVEGAYLDFSTTASYTPPITLCLDYDESSLAGPEDMVRILHFEGGSWMDVTTTLDMTGNVVCGEVSSLSPFAVAETSCLCTCHADPSCDGQTDVLDVVEVVGVAFRGFTATTDIACPHDPAGRTDVNCSGASDVLDAVSVVNVAFRGQPASANFCDPCAP